jgi:hypothetical protein
MAMVTTALPGTSNWPVGTSTRPPPNSPTWLSSRKCDGPAAINTANETGPNISRT